MGEIYIHDMKCIFLITKWYFSRLFHILSWRKYLHSCYSLFYLSHVWRPQIDETFHLYKGTIHFNTCIYQTPWYTTTLSVIPPKWFPCHFSTNTGQQVLIFSEVIDVHYRFDMFDEKMALMVCNRWITGLFLYRKMCTEKIRIKW